MKNKRSIYTIAIIFTCAILSSCSDWLDVNHNPNSAEKVDPGYLFNYAVVNWAGSRTGGDAYIPLSQSIQCQGDGGHREDELDLLFGHAPAGERKLPQHLHDFCFHFALQPFGLPQQDGKPSHHLVRLILE